MKLVRYRTPDGITTGLLDGEEITALEGLSVVELLILSPADRAARVDAARGATVPLADAELTAPVEQPGKFLALGFNFADHAGEQPDMSNQTVVDLYETVRLTRAAYPSPKLPTIFNKQTSSICGPFDPVLMPEDSELLDYEGELVIVIGAHGRRLSPGQALSIVGGYTVTNDISVRDWQWDTPTTWPGKSFDTHGPIGPCVVTADALDLSDLAIRTWVNGELRQDSSTAAMVLDVATIVSTISQICSLQPGDLIATGTPGGIGTPTANWLKVGDVMRVEVEGIGVIENTVVAEDALGPSLPEGEWSLSRS
ncbi:Ureidoglycolate lyase [Paraconexibacter sp. AEG42_29]|uniref:Ureidoglycolate lyase n=1 Tax=Paraconexibacter sp. AEG42_29 TaxID=2997339 RepID=A0AAU7AZE2_9ACTN